jgi:hypothetical protein
MSPKQSLNREKEGGNQLSLRDQANSSKSSIGNQLFQNGKLNTKQRLATPVLL